MSDRRRATSSKAKKKLPIVEAGPRPDPLIGDGGVRECLAWHPAEEKKGKNKKNSKKQNVVVEETVVAHRYLPPKPDIGRAKNHGYEVPEMTAKKNNTDDGHVIDALRGWPGGKEHSCLEGLQGYEYEYEWSNQDLDAKSHVQFDLSSGRTGRAVSGKRGVKSKGKKKMEENEEDPLMHDLMSHRYLSEYLQQREEEDAEKERKSRAGGSAKPNYRQIRINKASQLKALATGEKTYPVEKEMWKMSKFTQNAKPHLSTFRKGPKALAGGDCNGCNAGNEEAFVCTCPREDVYRPDSRFTTELGLQDDNAYYELDHVRELANHREEEE